MTWTILVLLAALGGTDSIDGLRSGRMTLLSYGKYENYEKATASFEHGVRDDPASKITKNDWDLIFGNNDVLDVTTVTDDESWIVDLGEATFRSLPALPDPEKLSGAESATAHAGHVYLVRTKDSDSDFLTLFRVVELVPGDRVTIDWLSWRPPAVTEPMGEELPKKRLEKLAGDLAAAAAKIREAERAKVGYLSDPVEIVLQLRAGAGGGNPNTVDLLGATSGYVDEKSDQPLSFDEPVNTNDRSVAFVRGGHVPEGKVLVIESVDVWGTAKGDGNGHGEAVVRVMRQKLVNEYDRAGPFGARFTGRVKVRPGDEWQINAEVANSSEADVRVRGRLVSAARAKTIAEVPLAWKGAAEAGPASRPARSLFIEAPLVILEVRAGAGGGNPNRVDMAGKVSIYVDRTSPEPLSFKEPVLPNDDAVAFSLGGKVPPGRVFVVKKVIWSGTAAGDSNGHGELWIQVGSEQIARIRDDKGPLNGTWTGRIEIRPGQEDRVFLEVANTSSGRVRIEGELVDAG